MAGGIKWIGMDGAVKTFKNMSGTAMKGLAIGLVQETETIMTKSKKVVPVRDGHLKNSGFAVAPKVNGTKVTVEMGYGGDAEAYALVQHERMDYAHTVGGPKFLERPVNDALKGLGKRLGKHVEREIKKGVR